MRVDFLYIRAPRAGSTWLEHMLARHPEVWLPPRPIIYFHPRFQLYRLKKLRRYMTGELVARDAEDKAWLRHFFARPVVSDRWYNSLFPSGRFAGEVAEAYCALPEHRIAHIARLMPDVKIIFTMRNPVERALSHARRGVVQRKARAANAVPESAYYWHIDHPSNEARTRYTAILDRWQRYFAPEQFHIA